ncbi:hypothetical protein [Dolichospermum sp. UHCC 0406]|nr:hypothetical protein [Dolichospermum sp. UHCC 0406]
MLRPYSCQLSVVKEKQRTTDNEQLTTDNEQLTISSEKIYLRAFY